MEKMKIVHWEIIDIWFLKVPHSILYYCYSLDLPSLESIRIGKNVLGNTNTMKLISKLNHFISNIDLPVLKKIELDENALPWIYKINLESTNGQFILIVEIPFEEGILEVKTTFAILTEEYVIADEGNSYLNWNEW